MTTVICEISVYSHNTYVVSLAQIFASQPENKVIVILLKKEEGNVNELKEHENIRIVFVDDSVQGISEVKILNEQGVDNWVFPTLEPTNVVSSEVIRSLFGVGLRGKLFFVVHNVNLWFHKSRMAHYFDILFSRSSGWIQKIYRIKSHYFSRISRNIEAHIQRSGGSFIVISNNIKSELQKFVTKTNIVVLPFSVFDKEYLERMRSAGDGILKVVIPGFVTNVRRDYLGFLTALETKLPIDARSHIEIDLLGGVRNIEQGDMVKIKALQMIADGFRIVLHQQPYLPMDEYDSALAGCDVVAGILNVKPIGDSVYGKTKETGIVYNMIKMAKPGFLPADYSFPQELSSSVIVYRSYSELIDKLIQFVNGSGGLTELKKNALNNSNKFTAAEVYRNQIALPLSQ